MKVLRSLLLCSLGILLFTFTAFGQATTSLRGSIKDQSGAVIPNVTVTLSNDEVHFTRSVTTSATGEFSFPVLPPGTYKLVAEAEGFRRLEQAEVKLLVDTPSTVNLTMTTGARNEVVSVTSEAPPLNMEDASMGIAFGENQVKQLPMEGRNVPDLLSLQAGVVYTGNNSFIDKNNDTRSGSVNGARSDQSNITLDGVDVNDQGAGYAFTSVLPVTLDSVQEFRVTTTNYNADEGRSSGAQVSLITKSGTNHWHGSAYEYLRNTITSANDWFTKGSQAANGEPNKAPKLNRNIFGGTIGGPIVKDRLFFFFNYEGTREREEQPVVRVVPSDSLRAGNVLYQIDPAAGGGVQTLTTADITGLDPLHKGPNAAVLDYLNSFPHSNDTSVGDGYNFVGYRFKAPISTNNNAYIARVDMKIDETGNHSLFWRGAMQNLSNLQAPYLPCGGGATVEGCGVPLHTLVDYSKGFVIGYTATLSNTLVNNFHYGYTRQSVGDNGNSSQPWIIFRGLNDNASNQTQSFSRSRSFQVPVDNLTDDVNWVRGRHTFGFGTNIAFIRSPRVSTLGSFSDGIANAAWVDTGGFANTCNSAACTTGSPLDPVAGGYPNVDPNFGNSYNFPMIALLGMVTEVDATYNYNKQGNQLGQGAPTHRHFAMNSYEFYAQDTFKLRPNLTITYGLRYSLFTPPWETTGLQVAPNVSLGHLLDKRGQEMLQGIGSSGDPLITFDLAGPANNKRGYYDMQKTNFAPRFAVAYSPQPSSGWLKKLVGDKDQTVIRAGFSMVYDHMGMGLLNTFDQNGSFGLSTTLTNPAGVITAAQSPRITGVHSIPQYDNSGNQIFLPAPPGTFPQTPPYTADTGGFAIAWGLDDTIKTPYSYTFNFGIGRELPHNFSIEASYVGRLGRHLLSQRDLMMPLDLVDPKSKIDYFTAVRALALLNRAGVPTSQVTAGTLGATAAYWQNIMPGLQPGGAYALGCAGGSTMDVVQAVYDTFACYPANDTTGLANLDVFGGIADANLSGVSYFPLGNPNTFFNRQYSSLYAWSTIGNSSYNALQVTLRRQLAQGVQFDFNYTYSKSIDISSDAERIAPYRGFGGQVINSWSPKQLRAVSDFDTPHQINTNWLIELPFGKGKHFASDAGRALDAVIGGWQFTGLARWTTGFPITVDNGYFFPTNWELEGNAIQTSTPHMGNTRQPDGSMNMFVLGPAANQANFRNGLPGESGSRNTFRADGFVGLDTGLSKRWALTEKAGLQFRWEVYNVPNWHRFDAQQNRPEVDIAGTFGNYTGLLTNPRVMQFALRFDF